MIHSNLWRRASSAFALAAAVMLTGFYMPAVAGELEVLLARHQAWRGGPPYAQLRTLRIEGSLAIAGLSGTTEYISTAEGEVYQNTDLEVFKQVQGVGADSGWVTTQSGQVEALSVDALNDARREAMLDFSTAIESSRGASLSLLPDEIRDGARWRVVHMDFGERDGMDLFLDPTTGAQHGYRKTQNNQTTFVRQSDWRATNGVRMPYLVETFAPIATDNSTLRVTHIAINPSLPENWLAAPVGARKVAFDHQARRTAWMPIDFKTHRIISFPGTVNGLATNIVLDSGAAITVINTDFAARAGIKSQGTIGATGVSGTQTASLAQAVDIHLGDLTLSNLTVAVIPMAGLSTALGREITVILGKELLNEVVVDVDFERERIAFESTADYSPPPGSIALPLNPNKDGLRTVDVRIEGGPSIPALFDLGNNGTLAINASYWEPQHLVTTHRASVVATGGVGGGAIAVPEIVVGSLTIGPIELAAVPADLSPRGPTTAESDRTLANVGSRVWSRFRVMADYAHNRLDLIPNATENSKPFAKDRSGLALERTAAGQKVIAVAAGAPAVARGWRAGDTIETVDGVSATIKRPHDWREGSPGTSVSLAGKSASGQPFKRWLVLEDFY